MSRSGKTTEERFWSKVNKAGDNECWRWKGTINNGKGVFYYQNYNNQRVICIASRFSYELHYGPIPQNCKIRHACNTKDCVNPNHLQLDNGSLELHFWSKVQKQDGDQCWLWTGSLNPNGYGLIYVHGKGSDSAHRVSYALTHGPITSEQCVCHKCDNPQCVRPDHLFLGTQKDNMRDCANKGRVCIPRFIGENVPNAKFKNEEVREIKRLLLDGWSTEDIITKFPKATRNDILCIRTGRNWGHIA